MVQQHSGKVGQFAKQNAMDIHRRPLLEALDPESIPKQRKLSQADITRWVAALEVLQGKYGNAAS